ncbi:hypothetical protein AAG906_011922 [Vitis piasezkii]
MDPSLALPGAGMTTDTRARDPTTDEAYEVCLRAVQILPIAEFQIGLAKLALLSGHLSFSQVFGAIQQAVQHAPHYLESHNLDGLPIVASYRLARCAINTFSGSISKSHLRDISFDIARSFSKARNALDAVQECEDLKKEGISNNEHFENAEIAKMRCLVALGKLVKQGSEHYLRFENGIHHLRKALHMFPKQCFDKESSRLSFTILSKKGKMLIMLVGAVL